MVNRPPELAVEPILAWCCGRQGGYRSWYVEAGELGAARAGKPRTLTAVQGCRVLGYYSVDKV
jgi:hypothetical protein